MDMEYEEIELIKQNKKSTIHLVSKKNNNQIFIRKMLNVKCPIYLLLKKYNHPYIPKLYEVTLSDHSTTIIEEYIEGTSLGSTKLSEKQLIYAFKELCSVLNFLHSNNIIHRDIKPSNIIFARDGHIRLIDFDAARMIKANAEQDTIPLGTRGYAPPEQYGFSQTDARSDIYSLGITLKQLLGNKANTPYYKRIIQKCTNLNPNNRYQSVKQVAWALSLKKHIALYGFTIFLLFLLARNLPNEY